MNAEVFFDTCVIVYAFTAGDPRQKRALQLLAEGGKVSVQVLNELANTCNRKLKFDWDETLRSVEFVRKLCTPPVPLTIEIHESGLRIAKRYGFSVFDGLILAAAIRAECSTLFSEDMQHGQVIDSVRIVNPFLAS